MKKPLDGTRVLDLTQVLGGPFCAMMLADMGADVIKIEPPGTGDEARRYGPPFVNGESAYFQSINRGKRSLTLNLKAPRGVEILLELASRAEVLLENFRPGTLERLGLSRERLRAANSQLIVGSISGYGRTGPYRDRVAYNFTIQAESGIMAMSGEPGFPPAPVGVSIGDIPPAIMLAYGVALALFDREKCGQVRDVDVSMFDTAVALMENPIVRYTTSGEVPGPIGRDNPSITPFGVYRARDQHFVIAVGSERIWQRFCMAIKCQDLFERPDFLTNRDRNLHRESLREILTETFAERDAAEWVRLLGEHGVPCSMINRVDQVIEHPQVKARGMVMEVAHPKTGRIRVAGTPLKLSGVDPGEARPAPLLGEHSEEVLGGVLAYPAAEVRRLCEEGVV